MVHSNPLFLTARLTARSTSLNWLTRSSASERPEALENWFDPVIGITADVNDDINAQVMPRQRAGVERRELLSQAIG